ncbi:MAG: hypothetical protein ACP5G1_03030 [Nanopusillaceae archaeon]
MEIKKALMLLFSILLINKVLALQININKIYPTIINNNTNVDLQICLINNDLQTDNLVTLYIHYPHCIYSNISYIYIYALSSNSQYCFPIQVYAQCPPGFYNIIINGTYSNNNGLSYVSQFYPLIIQDTPKITISNYTYRNNYVGAIGNLELNITNYGGIAYDLFIYSNYSTCLLKPSSIYLENLTDSEILNFNLIIPSNFAGNNCYIPLYIQYRDSSGSTYTTFNFVNIPIVQQNNVLQVFYNVTDLKIGENKIKISLYNPTESNISYIYLSFYNSNISIVNNQFYINNLEPKKSIDITLTLIIPQNMYGIINIPYKLSYYSNSILYNNQGYIVEKILAFPNITASGSYSSGTVTINLFNFGSSPAYNLYIDAYCSDCILIPSQGYVGELYPGNSNSIIFSVKNITENSTIFISVYYTDLYGNIYYENYSFSSRSLGFTQNIVKNEGIPTFSIILVIAIIFVIWVIIKILRGKKNED